MTTSISKPKHYYSPKNWPFFALKGFLWLLAQLPYRVLYSLGNGLGWIASRFKSKNGRILEQNLALCFPEKSAEERRTIATLCWQSHVIGAFETAMGWWGSRKKCQRLLTISGQEHLHTALASGRGIMLLASHFTSIELQGIMINSIAPFSSTAKHIRYPLADYEVNKARCRHLHSTLFPEDLKQVHKRLRAGELIGFILDLDYGRRGSVFAPFFNIPTATTTTLSRIAKATNSVTLLSCMYRKPGAKGYHLEFLPPFENYPSDDAMADATTFNAAIEKLVRAHPEQYGWTYKRFSTRPVGEASLYKD